MSANTADKRQWRRKKKVNIFLFTLVCAVFALFIVLHHNALADPQTERLKKACACALLTLGAVSFALSYDKLMVLPIELFHSRKLIWRLAVNDFKKRYAGSYMGVVWALVQPVVTVFMYWMVFDVIFNTRAQMVAQGLDVPYVLFLTALVFLFGSAFLGDRVFTGIQLSGKKSGI